MPEKSNSRPKLNAEWHGSHHMPKNATFEQKVEWHIDHLANCACRKPTGKMLEELKRRQIKGL